MMKLLQVVVASLTLFRAAQAYPPLKEPPPPSSEILLNANGANDAFAGVGRFQGAAGKPWSARR
jgi:hypothetical protein